MVSLRSGTLRALATAAGEALSVAIRLASADFDGPGVGGAEELLREPAPDEDVDQTGGAEHGELHPHEGDGLEEGGGDEGGGVEGRHYSEKCKRWTDRAVANVKAAGWGFNVHRTRHEGLGGVGEG